MKDEESRSIDQRRRKLDKHFAALIGEQKVKIVGYHFKPYKTQFESGQLIELVSKMKFPSLSETATIRIERGSELVHVKARWKGATHKPGIYTEQFLIIEEIKG